MNNYKSLPVIGQLMDEATASGVMRNVTTVSILSRTCAAVALTAACLFGATGCSSNYVIHTADGKTYATQGAPEFTDGGYSFTDSSGQHKQLLLSQVTRVSKP
ncbi:YgdI/YgdR family lipoprotein [Pseudomonas sp. HR96]|uniref:YgdI/YgdR family lipoprotein n=1 Tax=Pseudomonas sp. HR96 TaxID=1027966 RepID=UPI002A75F681|nr:YgdI/YgdR family lipoprotein [Pseudomonas sp. HR96]WPP01573.1 YgdI/YgdR family lipoprotein [Pseudomonas sp. HR96]